MTVNRYPLIRWKLQGYEDPPDSGPVTRQRLLMQQPVFVKTRMPFSVPEQYLKHVTNNPTSRHTIVLWIKQCGQCYWCGVNTLLRGEAGYFANKTQRIDHLVLSHKAATLDHWYSRFHPFRYQDTQGPRHVMACNKCNGKRSKEECLEMNQKIPIIIDVTGQL